ncbi:MAG: collagen-like protein [Puniceicoccales bacterium]|nr:collagen-like protein [Puniceicoccales bacterium]
MKRFIGSALSFWRLFRARKIIPQNGHRSPRPKVGLARLALSLIIGMFTLGLPVAFCEDEEEGNSGNINISALVSNALQEINLASGDNITITFSESGQITCTPAECIKFTGIGMGKTVTINGTTTADPIINAVGTVGTTGYNRGAFVSLGGVCGGDGNPFTLRLNVRSNFEEDPKERANFWYRSWDGATYDHFVGFGAIDAIADSCKYTSIVPSAEIPMSVILANNAWSTAFGAVSCSGQSGTFENFSVGPVAQDSTFVAGTIFGACTAISGVDFAGSTTGSSGACSGNFSKVTIGHIGDNSTLVARHSVFGAGYVGRGNNVACANNFSNWIIGPIGDNVSLTTAATAGKAQQGDTAAACRSACVFGVANAQTGSGKSIPGGNAALTLGSGICDDWTVEFQGSATVTAMAPFITGWDNNNNGNNTINPVCTLGGAQNSNMRFYFNDLAKESSPPSVVVAALRLQSPQWQSTDNPWIFDDNGIVANLDEVQERITNGHSPTLAVSMGPGFQLNVGRKRDMDEGSGRETSESVSGGGVPLGIGPGTLSIIGGIARAPTNTGNVDATLRVDSGWGVNCFGYVKDLYKISVRGGASARSTLNFYGPVEIPSGSTVTIGPKGAINLYHQTDTCSEFGTAFDQISSEAAFYADASSVNVAANNNPSTLGVSALNPSDEKIGLYQTDCGDRAFARKGTLTIGKSKNLSSPSSGANTDFGQNTSEDMVLNADGDLTSRGAMRIGDGSRVYFAGGTNDGGGYIQLNGTGGAKLTLDNNVKFSLLDQGSIPESFDYWIVRCPPDTDTNISGYISGLTLNGQATSETDFSIDSNNHYYKVLYANGDASGSLLDLSGTQYSQWWESDGTGNIRLLWSNNRSEPGLYIVGRGLQGLIESDPPELGDPADGWQNGNPENYIVLDPNLSNLSENFTDVIAFFSISDNVIEFVDDDQIRCILDSSTPSTAGIKFVEKTSAQGPTDTYQGAYSGKTVSITGTTTARPIISISGGSGSSGHNKGAIVSLDEVSGKSGESFTLKLDVKSTNTDRTVPDFYYHSGNGKTEDHFVGFGASDANHPSAYISIVPSPTIPMSVILENNIWSTVFGTVSCSGQSGTFKNFYVGSCAPDSTFVAGTIFGACTAISGVDFAGSTTGSPGACSNNFSNVTIGGMGANSTLVAQQAIFGGGYVATKGGESGPECLDNFGKWTIGPIGDDVSLTIVASSGSLGRSASVFGGTYMENGVKNPTTWPTCTAAGNFSNWTTEFQGSATVTAMAPYSGDYNQHSNHNLISTLGGGQNSNMRFYFNDLVASDPNVVVSALRLHWGYVFGADTDAYLTINPTQEQTTPAQQTLAISMGPGFQLNVGRRRVMLPLWNERAQGGWESPAQNGTWETDASVSQGGITHMVEGDHIRRIGPGTLNIIGGIAKAPYSLNVDTNSTATLRVSSGWDVNCFGYVKDLNRISVRGGHEKNSTLNLYGDTTLPTGSVVTIGPRGAINLCNKSEDNTNLKFAKAFEQIKKKAAFYADTASVSTSATPERIGLYRGDSTESHAFASKGKLALGLITKDGHADMQQTQHTFNFGGGITLTYNHDNTTLTPNGKMTIGDGSTLRFAGGSHGGYLQVDATAPVTPAPLSIGTDVKFTLLDTEEAIPCTFDYWIVRFPSGTTAISNGLIDGLTLDSNPVAEQIIGNSSINWGANYHKVSYGSYDASSSLLDLKDTAYGPRWKEGQDGQIRLLWSNDADAPGLYIVGRTPSTIRESGGGSGTGTSGTQMPTGFAEGILVKNYREIGTSGSAPFNFIVLAPGVYDDVIGGAYVFSGIDDNVIKFSDGNQINYTLDASHQSIDCIRFVDKATKETTIYTGDYAGKTVSIAGTTTARPIINVTGGATTENSTQNRGTFVSLNEVSGAEGKPFTLKLDVKSENGTADFWYKSSNGGTYDHFTGFGAPDAEHPSAYISIVPSETVPLSVILANNAWSTVFGTVSCSGQSDKFENLYVGPCAPDSTFVAGTIFGACKALSGTDFNAYRAGAISNQSPTGACSRNFSHLTIGGIGADSTLVAKQTVVGGGYVSVGANGYACVDNFRYWTIGPIGDNVSMTTLASASMTGRSACVFGAAYTGATGQLIAALEPGGANNCDQWTAEFQGSATVTAMAPYAWSSSNNELISTLGGEQNSNMRFYFNDLAISPLVPDNSRPSVVVSALRLDPSINVANNLATVTLNTAQESGTGNGSPKSALAVSMGPGFQLNVGRRRVMLPNWDERARGGWKSPANNGTWETDVSASRGGMTHIVEGDHVRHIGPGTLNIIGGIAKAPNGSAPTNATLRINSGWDMNCFGYVKDLNKISVRGGFEKASTLNFYDKVEIPAGSVITIGTRGAINLYRKNESCQAFNDAFQQVKNKAAFYADLTSGIADGNIGLYQTDNQVTRKFERKGTLQINRPGTTNFGASATDCMTVNDTSLKSNGRMVLGEGSKMRFAGGNHGGYLKIDKDTNWSGAQGAPLQIGSNVKFSLLDTEHTVPCTFDYWIVRFPAGTTASTSEMANLINGLTMSDSESIDSRANPDAANPPIKWGGNYYEVLYSEQDASISLLDLADTAYAPRWKEGPDGQIRLLWSNDASEPGLYIVGRTPPAPRGPQGEKGDTGATGPQGPIGSDGEDADPSEVAEILKHDSEFQDWVKGDKGDTGATGPQGPVGSDGEDADPSEVAEILKHDSEFQDWVKGDKGDTGATGPQGPVGSDGEDADPYAIARILASDEEFISDLAEEIKEDSEFRELIRGPRGEKGDKGEPGTSGVPGKDGSAGEMHIVHTSTALPPMDRVVLSRNIMRAKRTFMAKMLQAIDQRSCDIKGNNDPFVLVFGGYERCDVDESNLGSSSHFYGIFLGEDWSHHVFNNFYIRYGMGIGRVHSKSDFSGSLAEDFYGATCKETAGSAFISCEFYNEKHQKINLCATTAIDLGNNKVLRYDGKLEKFDDVSFHGKVAFAHEVHRIKGMRISPRMDLRYAFFHANAYKLPITEADQSKFITYLHAMFNEDDLEEMSESQLSMLYEAYAQTRVVPAVDNHMLDMTLGLNFEKEMEGDRYSVRPMKLQCDLGWQRRVMRKITGVSLDYGQVRNTFTLDMGNGPNDFFVCSGSFRKRLNPHWEIRGQWSGSCGVKYRCHSADLSLGYEF